MPQLSPTDFTYTVISCHFGDPFWIKNSLEHLDRYSDKRIERVILVDQSRATSQLLVELPRVSQVLTFTPDETQIEILGHDHPAALNRALASIDVTTSHVMILDSDCFPLDHTWLDALRNVTMAADPGKWGLSHPCLMTFPSELRSTIDFADGLLEVGIDTGRLVGLQIARSGTEVWFTAAKPAFRGYRGHYYLGGSVYHHGSASFASSPDERLSTVVSKRRESAFKRKIARSSFKLSAIEKTYMQTQGIFQRVSRLF